MADSHEQILKCLCTCCTEEEFSRMRCPRCGQNLTLRVRPGRGQFFVRCSADSTHLAMHGETASPPEWFQKYLGLGSYS